MGRFRLVLVAVLLSAVGAREASPAPARAKLWTNPAPTPVTVAGAEAGPVNPPFPDGGRIMFLAQDYEGGVGIVSADGSTDYFGYPVQTAMWDPSRRSGVLVKSTRARAPIRWYKPSGGHWRPYSRTPIEGVAPSFEVSSDGRLIAFNHSHGGRITNTIRVVDRAGVLTASLSGYQPVSWEDGRDLVVSDWNDDDLYLWHIRENQVRPFFSAADVGWRLPQGSRSIYLNVESMSWSGDRTLFSIAVTWTDEGSPRAAVVVGDRSGSIRRLIGLGSRLPQIPTWSPTRPLLAVPSSRRHGGARVEVYDVRTGERTLLVRSVLPWWAAWSPTGRWLLVDEPRRSRWLFVTWDGHRRITYPGLGSFPRWSGNPDVSVDEVYC
jgi:hypothetical protein